MPIRFRTTQTHANHGHSRRGALRLLAGRAACRDRFDRLEARTMLSGDGFERFDLPADTGSNTVVVGDFNGDGMMDVATSNAAAGTLSVMLNSPGGFSDTVNYEVGGTPSTLALIDIDMGKGPDLVAYDSTGNRLVALTNDGEGGFEDHGFITMPQGATYATVGHLNRDGSVEVVVAFGEEDRVGVYYVVDTGVPENSTGIELKGDYAVGDGPASVAIGDINGDGAPDLITANAGDGSVSVLLNTPSTFGPGDLADRLFQDLLGRVPSDQERSSAIDLIESGPEGRFDLALELVGQPSFTHGQVRRLFTQYMWRDPGTQELLDLAQLENAQGMEAVKVALLGSDEYFSGRAANDTGKFVNLVFADLLGRPVDPKTVAEGVALIDGGMTRGQFVEDLIDTDEYRQFVLKNIFDRFLHRMPSGAELGELFGDFGDDNPSTQDSGDDFSMDRFLARLLSSELYAGFAGGGTALFQDAVTTTVGAGSSSVVINEVNGDRKRDLVVANTGADTVSILLGKGDATFEAGPVVHVGDEPVHTFGFFQPQKGFMLASVNRGDDTVSAHLLRPDGTAELRDVIQVGQQPSWAAPGIFSAAGEGGMAVANAGDGTVTIITFTGHDGGDGDHGDSGGGYEDIAVPAKPDLHESSDLGESHEDNVTRLNNSAGRWLMFRVDGVQKGVFVNLYIDGVRMGNGLVRNEAGFVLVKTDGFTVLSDGDHEVTATITAGGREGRHSEALTITIKSPRVEVNNTDPNEPTNNDGKRARARVDEFGRPIVTIQDDDGGSTEYNLHDLFGDAPPIEGDLVVVDEVKHQYGQGAGARVRRYAAGQSSQGLLLYYNNEDGSWGQRNLTGDIQGAEAFASDDLDVLTTPWGNSNIFGKNDRNELVAYWQDGSEGDQGFNWNFINLGDHLAQTGQQQPAWEGDIESYSVPWGGMNVIAVDADGDVTAVWWAPGLDHWVYSNLSEITGAEKLVGTVSVSVTPWGGVNVLGTNALGHTIALWWAPGYEWQVTNMTLLANAPDYAAGSASSFSSIAGDIVVAGLTEAGNVAIFRWTLDDQTWHVTEITPPGDVTSALVGQLTGYANMNSELFVLGNNVDGEVVQFAFDADTDQWDVSIL